MFDEFDLTLIVLSISYNDSYIQRLGVQSKV